MFKQTLLSNQSIRNQLLVHICQNKKIANKIAANIASVNKPLNFQGGIFFKNSTPSNEGLKSGEKNQRHVEKYLRNI